MIKLFISFGAKSIAEYSKLNEVVQATVIQYTILVLCIHSMYINKSKLF